MGDWIDDFMDLTDGLPSPRLFRLWSAITCLAGALERRAWLETAQSNVYPNLFVVLVAPPGVGKTQAINPTEDLWKDTKGLHVMPNNVTKAALIDALAKADCSRTIDADTFAQYHSIAVPASELGVLLPAHDLEYLSVLNYVYDNPSSYREERRSIEKPIEVICPQLNILAGTQPGFLSATLPEEAWSMGFLSRVIMVYSGTAPRVPLFGKRRSDKATIRTSLVSRLESIAQLYGPFDIDEPTQAGLEAWAEEGFAPIPSHSKLVHYNARRVLHVLKLTMIAAISRCGTLSIRYEDLERARDWLMEAEAIMPDIFKDMMAKSDGAIIQELHSYMWGEYARGKNRPLHESLIWSYLQIKVPSERIPRILDAAERSMFISKTATGMFIPLVKNNVGIPEA